VTANVPVGVGVSVEPMPTRARSMSLRPRKSESVCRENETSMCVEMLQLRRLRASIHESTPLGRREDPDPTHASRVAWSVTISKFWRRRGMEKIKKSEQQWRAELTPEQFHVLREKGTERPFTGEYDHTFEPGTYRCAGCGAELFSSDAKYDSGCGWPAFSAPAAEEAIDEETDSSYGMIRTEVMCAACGGHLGHVFPDGPHPTGIRYCINSAALRLEEE
jgi:peptide-methionine (R)-S-oxide reductase